MNANPPREALSYPGVAVTPLPRGWRSGGHGLPVATPSRSVDDQADPLLAHGGGHCVGDEGRPEGVPSPVVTVPPTEPGAEEPSRATADPAVTPGSSGPAGEAGSTHPVGEAGSSHSGTKLGSPQTAATPGSSHPAATPGSSRPASTPGPSHPAAAPGPSHPAAEPGSSHPPDEDCESEISDLRTGGPEDFGGSEQAAEPDSAVAPESATGAEGTPVAAPRRTPAPGEWHGIVLVTGTDTEVGKTITTAAVAAAAQAAGLRVAVIKPGQTGTVTGDPTDAEVITRLAGPDTVKTLAEYPDPLAPLAAAKVAELPPLELYEVVDAIRAEADKHDLVLVEGAGGLLVPMGLRPSGEAWTFADLATTLAANVLVVARAGLGTLNHTALTLEALDRRGVAARVILGAWPAEPELVHWANLSELVPHLVGALPAGAGSMDPGVFRRSAPGWLTPALHGVLDNWRVWAEEAG